METAKQLNTNTFSTNNSKPSKKRSIIPTGKHIDASRPNRHTIQEQNDIADEFLKWYTSKEEPLFFTSFFSTRMISYRVIHNWKKSNEYFAYIYDLATQIREQRLQEKLMSTSQPTGIIFLLKNLHGYRNEPKEEPDDRTPEAVEFEFTVINDNPKN